MRLLVSSMWIVIVALLCGSVQAFHAGVHAKRTGTTCSLSFVSLTRGTHFCQPSVSRGTILRYKDDEDEQQGSEPPTECPQQQPPVQRQPQDSSIAMNIPILGPFPGQPPLLLGGDTIIDRPTPMQWQTLEEAVHIHQSHFSPDKGHTVVAAVEAAPMVAILDDHTGDTRTPLASGGNKRGRYATIAAVVGMSNNNNHNGTPDTTDFSALMDSVTSNGVGTSLPTERKIRLVGIGRALVHDFHYQIPTAYREDMMDEEGHLILEHQADLDDDHDDEDDDRAIDSTSTELSNKIILARFEILMDRDQRSKDYQLTNGEERAFASPVHAMNAMHNLANKIDWMHADRRKLVAGIQAAKARLDYADDLRQQDFEEELVDHDGIGLLFAQRDLKQAQDEMEREESQRLIQTLLREFGPETKQLEMPLDEQGPAASSPATEHDKSYESILADYENYGLGYSAASFSSVADLTKVWMEKLQPYYSPDRCQSEEYYYEVFSFVAVVAMNKYLTPADLGWSLQCTNTQERLEKAYEWMNSHVEMLKEEAKRASQALLDCGEECTDLW